MNSNSGHNLSQLKSPKSNGQSGNPGATPDVSGLNPATIQAMSSLLQPFYHLLATTPAPAPAMSALSLSTQATAGAPVVSMHGTTPQATSVCILHYLRQTVCLSETEALTLGGLLGFDEASVKAIPITVLAEVFKYDHLKKELLEKAAPAFVEKPGKLMLFEAFMSSLAK